MGDDVEMSDVAQRVMQGKTMNAGQICLAPDYALVPKEKVDDFVKESINSVTSMYPEMKDNEITHLLSIKIIFKEYKVIWMTQI
ncbi:MAG: hypothetical protein Ct9H90mP4_05950 [Gammaproteobacteria bacterium]|nr:MAG: hypothetical protein Ct9H90mP4_05950 [Gammaproteobacteria bacterium]